MRESSSAPPSAKVSRVRLFTAGHFHAACGLNRQGLDEHPVTRSRRPVDSRCLSMTLRLASMARSPIAKRSAK